MSCHVWCNFQATRSDGTLVKLRIQDCPESRVDDVLAFYTKYMANDGLFNRAAGVRENPAAVEESLEMTTKLIKNPGAHIMICCEDKDNEEVGQITGVSLMTVVKAESESFNKIEPKTKEVQMYYKLLNTIFCKYAPLEQLNVSQYYADIGLVVLPEFRKLGIATQFLKARRLVCLAHDVPATVALMTSVCSEKAAGKDNWVTVLEVDLGDLSRQHGVTFDSYGVRKIMVWKKT